MLRITRIDNPDATTLKLEGKLMGPWVDEFEACWAKLAEKQIRPDIDLNGLSFLDANGTGLLLRMERQGTQLVGGSAFIRCLLHPELFRQERRLHESSAKES